MVLTHTQRASALMAATDALDMNLEGYTINWRANHVIKILLIINYSLLASLEFGIVTANTSSSTTSASDGFFGKFQIPFSWL